MLSSLEQYVILALIARDAGYINGNQGRLTHYNKDGKINKKNKYAD